MSHQACSHADVNQPYGRVRATLLANPSYVFRQAIGSETTAALKVVTILDDASALATRLSLGWSSAHAPEAFPVVWAMLVLSSLPSGETRLEMSGTYQSPVGKPGQVFDRLSGQRTADAAVRRFVREVAVWLREELEVSAPVAAA